MIWLVGITDTMDMNFGNLREMVRDRRPGALQSMGSQRIRHDWEIKQQQHDQVTEEEKALMWLHTDIHSMQQRSADTALYSHSGRESHNMAELYVAYSIAHFV